MILSQNYLVRNKGFNTTQEELEEAFQKYVEDEESEIVTDKKSGKSKGFGFLKFYDKKSDVKALIDG